MSDCSRAQEQSPGKCSCNCANCAVDSPESCVKFLTEDQYNPSILVYPKDFEYFAA